MKLYTKTVDGQTFTMPASKIVLIKDNMQVFNPTETMLLEDGWEIYEQEFVEPTDEVFEPLYVKPEEVIMSEEYQIMYDKYVKPISNAMPLRHEFSENKPIYLWWIDGFI